MKNEIVMPSAWQDKPAQPIAKPVQAKTDVTARVDMSADVAGAGLCPVCRRKMEEGFADGAHVRFCRDDLVTLPLTNDEISARDQAGVDEPRAKDNWVMPDFDDTYGAAFN